MKNWIMSMTSTPHSPECAAKTTFSRPTASSVCQRSSPNSTAAILQAARFTVAMIMQLKKKAEVDGAEAAHGAGGLAGVAQFVELQIGEHAGAAPQPRDRRRRWPRR